MLNLPLIFHGAPKIIREGVESRRPLSNFGRSGAHAYRNCARFPFHTPHHLVIPSRLLRLEAGSKIYSQIINNSVINFYSPMLFPAFQLARILNLLWVWDLIVLVWKYLQHCWMLPFHFLRWGICRTKKFKFIVGVFLGLFGFPFFTASPTVRQAGLILPLLMGFIRYYLFYFLLFYCWRSISIWNCSKTKSEVKSNGLPNGIFLLTPYILSSLLALLAVGILLAQKTGCKLLRM